MRPHPVIGPSPRTRIGALFAALIMAGGSWAASPEPTRLTLQAKLFYSASGTFSADVLAPGGPELFNVVASDDPSTASLVTVVVTLPKEAVLRSDARVRLVARESASRSGAPKTLTNRTVAVGAVAKGGVTHLGFWLQGTGCRTVQLEATLTVPGQVATVATSSTVPFACAE